MRRGGCPAQHNVAMGPPESRARFPGRRKDTFLKEKPCPSFVCGTLAFCRQTKQASSRPVLHEVSGIGTHFSPPRRPLPLTLTANESAERKSKANYGGRRCIRFCRVYGGRSRCAAQPHDLTLNSGSNTHETQQAAARTLHARGTAGTTTRKRGREQEERGRDATAED